MKNYFLLPLFVVLVSAVPAADIPVGDPKAGEERPSWWWSCWLDPVVVVEGIVSYVDDNTPDVTVVLGADALRRIDDEEKETQKTFSHYYIGTVEVEKVLFAAPGSERSDFKIGRLAMGEKDTLPILIPAIISKRALGKIIHNDKAVIILTYQSMGGPFPYINQGSIPEEGIESAKKLFEHRRKFNHLKPEMQQDQTKAQQGGTGQPATAPESKPEGGQKPQPESKVRPR